MENQSSIRQDYEDTEPLQRQNTRKARHHYLLLLAGTLIGLGIMLGFTPDAATTVSSESQPALDTSHSNNSIVLPLSLPHTASDTKQNIPVPTNTNTNLDISPQIQSQTQGKWHTVSVGKGDNLSLIFNKLGLSAQQLQSLLEMGGDTVVLEQLHPGDEIKFYIDFENQLKSLVYDVDETRTLQITSGDGGFHINTIQHHLETRVAHASGVIKSSLFLSAQQAGLSDNLTMQLASIFGWDIDFALDLREGDSFMVIYEELYLNGEKLRDGNILAAEFVNKDTPHRAIRFTDNSGHTDYFSPDGKNMRKAFLRTPVAFTRISSGFSLARRHPILNLIRAHKGVDYAAPIGTPVKATGDGKIAFRGTNGGYGKSIIIQHGSTYSTVYAHLSAYARGTATGSHVKQGQIIAYVGMTGLATGPHLHYEFRVNGVHHDPLTVKLPDAAPLAAQNKNDFIATLRPLMAQLDALNAARLALNP